MAVNPLGHAKSTCIGCARSHPWEAKKKGQRPNGFTRAGLQTEKRDTRNYQVGVLDRVRRQVCKGHVSDLAGRERVW
jgi:hypothetical protein